MKTLSLLPALAVVCLLFVSFGVRNADAQFEIPWHTIDSGGGFSNGGGFELNGTIGQHDASQEMTGGGFSLTGGFWTSVQDQILLGDVNMDGMVNLLDVAPFIDAISAGTYIPEADVNQDGAVNLLDVSPFIEILAGG